MLESVDFAPPSPTSSCFSEGQPPQCLHRNCDHSSEAAGEAMAPLYDFFNPFLEELAHRHLWEPFIASLSSSLSLLGKVLKIKVQLSTGPGRIGTGTMNQFEGLMGRARQQLQTLERLVECARLLDNVVLGRSPEANMEMVTTQPLVQQITTCQNAPSTAKDQPRPELASKLPSDEVLVSRVVDAALDHEMVFSQILTSAIRIETTAE